MRSQGCPLASRQGGRPEGPKTALIHEEERLRSILLLRRANLILAGDARGGPVPQRAMELERPQRRTGPYTRPQGATLEKEVVPWVPPNLRTTTLHKMGLHSLLECRAVKSQMEDLKTQRIQHMTRKEDTISTYQPTFVRTESFVGKTRN
jgi:hypothetical protein